MDFKLSDIAQWYIEHLLPADVYFSHNPVKDTSLLFPPFLDLVQRTVDTLDVSKNIVIATLETYRSNTLQHDYFESGASKIPKNGMHHYGIAVDTWFVKTGYKGDWSAIHEVFESLGGPQLDALASWDPGHLQLVTIAGQNDLRSAVASAIVQFQKDNGLTADGIPGPLTHTKAIEVYGDN